MNIQSYLTKKSKQIDSELERCLSWAKAYPKKLHEAMHYSVFPAGKRVRPVLVLAAAEAVGGEAKQAMSAACAIEFIHSYSLIHDDLPCMDNDDLRRGKPSCHIRFGEDTAILAGDALLTLAFEVLSTPGPKEKSLASVRRLQAASLIAQASGSRGMVGGQAMDIEFQKANDSSLERNLPTMEFINTHKTGALIAVSTRTGALLGGGSPAQVEALYRYGKQVGHLFQIVDDIMDKEGYAKLLGATEAQKQANLLAAKAKKEIKRLGNKAAVLEALADYILMRKN